MAAQVRFQFRLLACHVAGVLAEFIAMPHLLAWGLAMDNVVLAWIIGVAFFLILAIVGGLIWRGPIRARPLRSAVAAPAILVLAIYISIRALSGFAAEDSRLALEASVVGGLCALFSSAIFLLWTAATAAGPRMTPTEPD